MIPKAYRLQINAKNPFLGKKQYSSWAVIITKPSSQPQWAVRVSKQIDKRAVVRNTLRRQLNHWLYQHLQFIKPQQVLIILRHKPDKENLPGLFEELKKLLFLPS